MNELSAQDVVIAALKEVGLYPTLGRGPARSPSAKAVL